jgi:hypothetical protein
VKLQHGLIPGLRKFLEKIAWWDEISSVNPGGIKQRAGSGAFSLRIQYRTKSGLKCIARSGSVVQEVFFVTSDLEGLERRLCCFVKNL